MDAKDQLALQQMLAKQEKEEKELMKQLEKEYGKFNQEDDDPEMKMLQAEMHK